ncbi:hypothetical protein GQ43DRAFT_103940 [Delitschia confertaspora ATCC 74209]|uniref:Uncharacterized protein n=1 Tax=Delitschia confertaspora ATCC 74209 TaxID=1513339 RepID=A0A9P4MXC4_9PLEO|nr:hypothetical protein GQ43DRAFT_103940 [Delitschia confertaspora ATCC 74209]
MQGTSFVSGTGGTGSPSPISPFFAQISIFIMSLKWYFIVYTLSYILISLSSSLNLDRLDCVSLLPKTIYMLALKLQLRHYFPCDKRWALKNSECNIYFC